MKTFRYKGFWSDIGRGFGCILTVIAYVVLLSTGLTASASAVDPGFTVDFQANITSGNAPLTLQFESLATGAPVAWSWGIDNQIINETQPQYTFAHPGSYSINLTVTNELNETLTETKSNYIVVTSSADQYASVSFISGTIWGNNPIQIIDKTTGKPVPGNYNTTSKDIHLDPNHDFTVLIMPGGITDLPNSADYALIKLMKNSRQNLIGLAIIMFILAFLVTRKK